MCESQYEQAAARAERYASPQPKADSRFLTVPSATSIDRYGAARRSCPREAGGLAADTTGWRGGRTLDSGRKVLTDVLVKCVKGVEPDLWGHGVELAGRGRVGGLDDVAPRSSA